MAMSPAEGGHNSQAGMLSRVPLRDQAVEVLREMVISGELAAGERINEAELAARLGISRGPLREAIQRLGAEGFIEFRQNRGAFVRTITLDDVRQMYEVRELIEVKAAQMAAASAPDAQIDELRQLLDSAARMLRADRSVAYPTDFDLHEYVLQMSGNPFLHRVGMDLQNQVRLARVTSGRAPERARQALDEHQSILAAIAARDSRAAGRAMREHLQKSLTHLSEAATGD